MHKKLKQVWSIIDLQFGSTGKGLLAGYLAKRRLPDTLITAWGPNAGHTFIDENERKYVHTMLANGVVSSNLERVMIGPGSVIHEDNLLAEINACSDHLDITKVFIHENAAVVMREHAADEVQTMRAIGSTSKGVGTALIQRIQRNPEKMNIAKRALTGVLQDRVVTTSEWIKLIEKSERIQIEGAQGASLSMYHGFYPYVTSRDVSQSQVLADCGVPFALGKTCEVIGTLRTFPIRVANRYLFDKMVGYSGPGYEDQEETSFEAIGQQQEFTTVTKLPRRIFTYSKAQIEQAVAISGVDSLFLNFCNYASGAQLKEIKDHLKTVAPLCWMGYGPAETNVHHV